MKKNAIVVLALVICSTLLYARTDHARSKVAVIKQNNRIKLCYESPSKSTVKVSILNDTGQELFREEITSKNFIRPYNLSGLPRGNYSIIINDESGEHVENIKFYDRANVGRVVQLDNNENKFLVTIPKMGNNEVTVCVYDIRGDLVFSEVADCNSDYAKVYNLKNFAGGSIELFDLD